MMMHGLANPKFNKIGFYYYNITLKKGNLNIFLPGYAV